MCIFKAICGDNWLTAFVNLVSCLRRNEIHCVFIYDNGAVAEKDIERARRVEQRRKTEEKVSELENALDQYDKTFIIDPVLKELYKKLDSNLKIIPQRRLLIPSALEIQEDDTDEKIDMKVVREKVQKMRSQILAISPQDFETTRELFEILNVPYFLAPLEAETCCSDLCKRGIVDAVLTEDTDVLAYGANVFLSKIDTIKDVCVRINYEEMLSALNLSADQFTDLCIMCGCDYNTNVPKVGPETSFKYLLKYKDIDAITEELNIDVSNLNHKRVRDLFKNYEQIELKSVPFVGKPDIEKLEEFMTRHNIRVCKEKLIQNFIHNVKIFDGEEDDNIKIEFEIEEEE
jgi:5'-3' exonuclease